MTNEKIVSFEELGWGFFYDEDGKYPLQKDDAVSISPNEVITLYYRSPTIQDSNGRFYGNSIEAPFEYPFFFFNMCYKEDKYNDVLLFGDDESVLNSLHGKVESVAMWNRKLEQATVENYHTNTIRMMGADESYLYDSIDSANSDGLFAFYEFDTAGILTTGFDGVYSTIGNRIYELGSGKSTNSSVIDRGGDRITINNTRLYSNFSFNFRFYIEELKDFTIIYAEGSLSIKFDEARLSFVIDMYPHVGTAKTFYVPYENIKVHHWYDLMITYGEGLITVFIDGVKESEYRLNIDLGGVYSIYANNSNFESIDIDAFYAYAITTHGVCGSDDSMGITYSLRNVEEHRSARIDVGAKEVMNMMFGKNRDFLPTVLGDAPHTTAFNEIDRYLDEYSYNKTITMGRKSSCSKYSSRYSTFNMSTLSDDSISFEVSGGTTSTSKTYYTSKWTNALLPHGMIKVTLTVKNEIVSDTPVFPMIFTMPSLPVSVKRSDITDLDSAYSLEPNAGRGDQYEIRRMTIDFCGFTQVKITEKSNLFGIKVMAESNSINRPCTLLARSTNLSIMRLGLFYNGHYCNNVNLGFLEGDSSLSIVVDENTYTPPKTFMIPKR